MANKQALLQEREVRRREQERFLAVYDEVKAELMRIPGVVEVSVGLRERGGALTAEPTFRVHVEQ
jgi:antibiotic biosynthesis monooxygenase (ABM) superfamily enzyme